MKAIKGSKTKITLEQYLTPMTKELNLTLGERAECVKMFDEFKGNVTTLASIIDDIKAVSIKKEEWDTVPSLVKTPQADGSVNWFWEDAGTEKPVVISDSTCDYLKAKIKEKSEANQLDLSNKAVLTLNNKLQ